MKRTNPIAARVEALPGQQLPTDWRQKTADHGGTYDRRDLSQLWREPQWTARNGASSDNLIQNARLSK